MMSIVDSRLSRRRLLAMAAAGAAVAIVVPAVPGMSEPAAATTPRLAYGRGYRGGY